GLSACGFLARIIVTYAYIFVCSSSSIPRRYTFNGTTMLPYPSYKYEVTASVIYLCPIIIHAEPLDQ
ncbi:unnamed protein product, partial [Ectocarpus sp. 12 AP-2014]